MSRSAQLRKLVMMIGAAVWFGAPAQPTKAQVPKPVVEAKPNTKAVQDAKGPPRVSLLRIQVVKPEPPQGPAQPGVFRQQRFGYQAVPPAGTSLTFLVEDPDRLIDSVETNDCRITKFTDDKGTDLLEEKAAGEEEKRPQFMGRQQFEGPFMAELDPGGHRATVTVHSRQLPASSANKILLDANLVLKYSRGERTVEQKNVNLKLDKITVGPFPMIIATSSDARMMMMGRQAGVQDAIQVMLFHQGPLQGIKKVAFIGPDDNEIQSMPSGSGSNGYLQQTYYRLTGKHETCTVRITVPEVVEMMTVAISVTTGVGFPPGVRRTIVPTASPERSAADGAPR
jgi:hypothetical protein